MKENITTPLTPLTPENAVSQMKAFNKQCGEFYIYFNSQNNAGTKSYIIATLDNNKYTDERLGRGGVPIGTVSKDKRSITVFSWTHNQPRRVFFDRVTSIQPLRLRTGNLHKR